MLKYKCHELLNRKNLIESSDQCIGHCSISGTALMSPIRKLMSNISSEYLDVG